LASSQHVPERDVGHERFLLDQCLVRYQAIEDLIARTERSGQALAVWQSVALALSAALLATLLILADDPGPWLIAPPLLSMFLQCAGATISARVAFWAPAQRSPAPPQRLPRERSAEPANSSEALVSSYENAREFLRRLQHRLKRSVMASGAGVALLG